MKKQYFIYMLVFALFSLSALYAQGRMTPEERANQLKERLKLNDEQTAKVKNIYSEFFKDMQKLREENTGDRQEMRTTMRKKIEEVDKKIEKLLTDKQKEEFQKMINERSQRRRNGMRGGGRNN